MPFVVHGFLVALLLASSACGSGNGAAAGGSGGSSGGLDALDTIDGSTTAVVPSPSGGLTVAGGGSGEVPLTALEGIWLGRCVVDDDGVGSDILFYIVSGLNFEVVQSSDFDRNDCLTPELNYSQFGSFAEVGESDVAGRGTQVDVDVTTESYTFTMVNQAAADAANSVETCGLNNWSAGVSFDVSDCFVPSVPYVEYDLYLIDGNLLYFGLGGASDTAAGRPTQIADRPAFERS